MSGTSIVPLDSDSPKNHNKIIAWLTGTLTLLLALFSFTPSFNALADLATKHGVSIPILFPFVVEFAVVIFSLHALHRSLSGESAKVQWMPIIGSSLLAGTFNIAHAKNDAVSIEQRRDELTQIIANEGDIRPSALAKRLNISRGTVYRDLQALFEAGQIVKNGSGWEAAK